MEPYGLLNHGGGWYVLGKSRTHREDRVFVFKLERIRSVTVLEDSFVLPADFDLRKYRGERMFITGLAPVQVTLRLRGQAARRLAPQFKRARLERGGAMVVRFRDCPNGWLAAWVLRQGPEVEVLSPPGLAAWVGELARRVSAAQGWRTFPRKRRRRARTPDRRNRSAYMRRQRLPRQRRRQLAWHSFRCCQQATRFESASPGQGAHHHWPEAAIANQARATCSRAAGSSPAMGMPGVASPASSLWRSGLSFHGRRAAFTTPAPGKWEVTQADEPSVVLCSSSCGAHRRAYVGVSWASMTTFPTVSSVLHLHPAPGIASKRDMASSTTSPQLAAPR